MATDVGSEVPDTQEVPNDAVVAEQGLKLPKLFSKKKQRSQNKLPGELTEKQQKHANQKRINGKLHYEIKKAGGFVMEKWNEIQAYQKYKLTIEKNINN